VRLFAFFLSTFILFAQSREAAGEWSVSRKVRIDAVPYAPQLLHQKTLLRGSRKEEQGKKGFFCIYRNSSAILKKCTPSVKNIFGVFPDLLAGLAFQKGSFR